jgi:hypothetical protein
MFKTSLWRGRRASKHESEGAGAAGVLRRPAAETAHFRSDKEWQAYMRQNPRPSELPSKDDIEAAVQYVETKRRRMRGER